jgi:hypothetical protein
LNEVEEKEEQIVTQDHERSKPSIRSIWRRFGKRPRSQIKIDGHHMKRRTDKLFRQNSEQMEKAVDN